MNSFRFTVIGLVTVALSIISVSHTFAYGEGSIGKEDACKLGDGISATPLTIKNYTGYSTRVGSYYKDKKILYYIVDAVGLQGEKREAFLWSWDCTKKKAKQLSTYNFADYQKNEKQVEREESWIDTNDTIKIIFADKEHIIVKQGRYYKGPQPPDKFLVYYRYNRQINENFILEKLLGFQAFKKQVLNKTMEVRNPMRKDDVMTKITTKEVSGFKFFLDNIYSDADGKTFITVGYRGYYVCPPTVGKTTDECKSHSYTLSINLATGYVRFDPSVGINY